MKTRSSFFNLLFFSMLLISCREKVADNIIDKAVRNNGRTDYLFDSGWYFHRGDTANASDPSFNDSGWRRLDLPHDWSIEDIPGTNSPIDSTAPGGLDAGYLVGGTGWYRKSFYMPEKTNKKRFLLQFDGIYMNADVWLNGKLLGNHPYGYTSFRYDITDDLLPGKENVIAVKVNNEGHNSRWYTGSGIYRHVTLSITDPVHLDPWWMSVTTDETGPSESGIHLAFSVFNNSGETRNLSVISRVSDPSGKEYVVKELTVKAQKPLTDIRQEISITSPALWSVDDPQLYSLSVEISTTEESDRKFSDKITLPFGIRTMRINAEEGFVLNGKPIELKGGCVHHDNGPLGAAAFDRAEERRVELMKANGFNAIRCSHNPPSPAFLDACDRLGMLVIDESFDMWKEPKNPDDYHLYFDEWWQKDVESMVRRDRNHPSVVLWSIGNEIPERGKPEGARLANIQADFIRSIDSSRMITSAVNSIGPDKDPYFEAIDICGYNYAVDNYVPDHKRLPTRVILSTESFPLEAFKYWTAANDYPWVIGDFVWTGFDYLGEASIGWLGYPHDKSFYPWTQAYCGDIDICGFKRPQSYYRDVLWGNGKQISVFVKPPVPSFPLNPDKAEWSKWEWRDVVPSWNWEGYEGKPLKIEIYSSCEYVELLLNDKSLGKKRTERKNEWTAVWEVEYQPGTLTAIGYNGSNQVASSVLKTAGIPSRIRLTADRNKIISDGQDLSYITVELVDENGNVNPAADDNILFTLSGPGMIQAVDSSNPMGIESFVQPHRKAFRGKCLVIIRAGKEKGDILLKASSQRAGEAEININVD
jgi:beta-galactosidase